MGIYPKSKRLNVYASQILKRFQYVRRGASFQNTYR